MALKPNVEPHGPVIVVTCEYSLQEGGGAFWVMVKRGPEGLRRPEPCISVRLKG